MNQAYSIEGAIPIAQQDVDTRATFIGRTYSHLFGAILLFTGLQFLLFTAETASGATWNEVIFAALSHNWLYALGGFMVVSWLATHTAHQARSLPIQYLALGGFVAADAVIFCPLLTAAVYMGGNVLQSATFCTLAGFLGLTIIAFMSRRDFTFLGGILKWGFLCALVAIFGGMFLGYDLGLGFSIAMVGLAGGAILYDTSKILHHYPEDRYVGAALELFASVALLFWYVLRIFMANED